MKKIIAVKIAIFYLLSHSFGQNDIGIKGGLNVLTIKNENWKADDVKLGVNCGVFANIRTKGDIFFRPELLYSNKGFKFSANSTKNSGVLNLHYISLPLLSGLRLDKFEILLGPEVSFLAYASSKYEGSSRGVTDTYRRIDLGLDLGMTYNLKQYLGLDIRYCYGFKILKGAVKTHPLIDYVPIQQGSNRSLEIGVFYKFCRK